jgi:hypothetical protein
MTTYKYPQITEGHRFIMMQRCLYEIGIEPTVITDFKTETSLGFIRDLTPEEKTLLDSLMAGEPSFYPAPEEKQYALRNIEDSEGFVNSVFPATEYLTFGPWIYMVPQYLPKNVLILGYAGGTVAGLIRLIYGKIPITAVDIEFKEDAYGVDFVQADAMEYLRNCPQFDTVVVDIFQNGEFTPPAFVFSQEFADLVSAKANYIILHAKEGSDISAYTAQKIKTLELNTSRFHYFMVNDIPTLPVR